MLLELAQPDAHGFENHHLLLEKLRPLLSHATVFLHQSYRPVEPIDPQHPGELGAPVGGGKVGQRVQFLLAGQKRRNEATPIETQKVGDVLFCFGRPGRLPASPAVEDHFRPFGPPDQAPLQAVDLLADLELQNDRAVVVGRGISGADLLAAGAGHPGAVKRPGDSLYNTRLTRAVRTGDSDHLIRKPKFGFPNYPEVANHY